LKIIKHNYFLTFFFLIPFILFNKYSWIYFFDSDGILFLWQNFFLHFFSIIFLISSLLFFINRKINYLKFFFKIIFYNFFFLIFFVICFELFFGNWFTKESIQNLNIIRNKKINYNLKGIYEWNDDKISYSRDKWGLRGLYPNINKIDILTIGGSTTDQHYISDGFTFQDIMHQKFLENNKNVFIVNAGIDGQSTYGHILNFKKWFPKIDGLNVDYIMFYVGINDFYIEDKNSYDDLIYEKKNIKNLIKSKSILFDLYRLLEGILEANAYGLIHDISNENKNFSYSNWVSKPNLENHKEIMKNKLEAYEKRLNILCDETYKIGAKPIFVTQSQKRTYDYIDNKIIGVPVFGNFNGNQLNGLDYRLMIKMMNLRVKKVSQLRNCIFIDLENELEFDLKNDFYDNSHNTPSGSQKIGNYLYEEIKELF